MTCEQEKIQLPVNDIRLRGIKSPKKSNTKLKSPANGGTSPIRGAFALGSTPYYSCCSSYRNGGYQWKPVKSVCVRKDRPLEHHTKRHRQKLFWETLP